MNDILVVIQIITSIFNFYFMYKKTSWRSLIMCKKHKESLSINTILIIESIEFKKDTGCQEEGKPSSLFYSSSASCYFSSCLLREDNSSLIRFSLW
jgi:hypothetical protein